MIVNKDWLSKSVNQVMKNIENIPIDKNILLRLAKEKYKDTLLKNGDFKFTKEDESLLLKDLEERDNNHFYVKSDYLLTEIKIITDKISTIFQEHYSKPFFASVVITDNPELGNNAFALPNGTILIDLTLLQSIDTLDELYFVIAHECAHILCAHTTVFNNVQYYLFSENDASLNI
jgi:predicted metal-dependent hydrolase